MLALLDNVEKDYGAQAVLRGVTLSVEPGDRLALVGRNGAGKSTLLRLLTGVEKPDGGTVRWSPGVRARALKQDPTFDADATVHEILDAAFHDLDALEVELSAAAAAMSDDASIAHHAELLEHYARRGGFERRARRDAVALAFGFRGREGERVGKLSGGERTRLGLAALLVENPDVLLLDEPTNHLDIVMVEWLEGFLARYPGALLLVSHDRAFLDAVSSETAHLWHGQLRRYPGNYSAFREGLEAELERQAAKYAQESRKIADFEKSTARMKIWGLGMSKLARRARSMETRLERMRAAATAPPPPEERTSSITFYAPESGEVVLDARHVSKALGGRPLFNGLDLTIRRGERIALIGRNGAGKTTLLRALLGLSPSDDARSEVRLGSRVKLGYYDQQLRGVDEDSTLYREARDLVQKDQEAHDLLGTFMFPYDTHDKPVAVLSGGERARLALLKLAQEDNNFLVLDEPSNHLDMEMLESLEAALDAYTGTLLMVSHDRRLIENLADRIWLLEDGRFYEYPGGYAYYREKHQPLSTEPELVRTVIAEARPKTKGLWHLKRQLESVEAEVTELESRLERAQQAIAAAAPDADFARLGTEAADLETALGAKLDEWERVQGEVEARA